MSTASHSQVASIRVARASDADAVARATRSLLTELGAADAAAVPVEGAFAAMLERPGEATVLLGCEPDGSVVGLLAVSWPLALRAGGRYGLIQELWVERGLRGRSVGAQLLDALVEHAGRRQIPAIEVGLPRESFDGLERTRSFYRANAFEELGSRMRRRLA